MMTAREGVNNDASRNFFDSLFIVALLILSIFSYIYIIPAILGQERAPISSVLAPALFPFFVYISTGLIERAFPPAGPRKSLRSWMTHAQLALTHGFFVSITFIVALVLCNKISEATNFNLGIIDLRFSDGNNILLKLCALWVSLAIVFDFFFYWFHRAMHKSEVLWQHHKLHHMDVELEAITNGRTDWVESVLAAIAIAAPSAILFKTDAVDIWNLGLLGGLASAILSIILQSGHLNVKLQAGRWSVLWCTPQVHRIHHSILPQHHDKNFAFVLPLWDILFGTYYAPKWNEFPPTGVKGETEIRSFWEAQTFTIRGWWKMIQKRLSENNPSTVNESTSNTRE